MNNVVNEILCYCLEIFELFTFFRQKSNEIENHEIIMHSLTVTTMTNTHDCHFRQSCERKCNNEEWK